MRQSYKTKSVCVVDQRLFPEFAVKLAPHFGKVFYHSQWKSAFPSIRSRIVGYGLNGIERINHIWDRKDDVDLWVFPDVCCGDDQLELESQGRRVFGSRFGDDFENYRSKSRERLKKLGVAIGPYEVIPGIAKLRAFLKENENWWVKTDIVRGDFETFHSPNYATIEPFLNWLENHLGAAGKVLDFLVEQGIDEEDGSPVIEAGYDGYCINGEWPTTSMVGIEVKNKGYVGMVQRFEDLPPAISDLNNRIAKDLRGYHYENFFSSELRITNTKHSLAKGQPVIDGKYVSFSIDPCCRAGSPPSEVYMNTYTNLPDIFWYGAEGVCIDAEFDDPWAGEVMLSSAFADKNWVNINFPEKLRDNVKLRNVCMIDGKYYAAPEHTGAPEIGAIVATGKSLDDVREKLKEIAKQVQAYNVEIPVEALDQAEEEFAKLAEMGITFKDPPSGKENKDMPVTTRKGKGGGYTNATPGGVKGRHMTRKNAEKQKRLLNAIDHGFRPSLGRVGK